MPTAEAVRAGAGPFQMRCRFAALFSHCLVACARDSGGEWGSTMDVFGIMSRLGMTGMKILGLCGSLRSQSRRRVLLELFALLGDGEVEIHIFHGLGDLPLFNSDNEHRAPPAVHALWDAVSVADALIVSSPEYAHGMTGTLKNALDWLVGHVPFVGIPVAVLNPSNRAEHADASLQ